MVDRVKAQQRYFIARSTCSDSTANFVVCNDSIAQVLRDMLQTGVIGVLRGYMNDGRIHYQKSYQSRFSGVSRILGVFQERQCK